MRIRLLFLLALSIFGSFAGLSAFARDEESGEHGNWAVTAELSERRLAKEPQNEKAWADLVQARLDGKDFKRAEKALNEWRSQVPHPEPRFELLRGELAFAREDFSGAADSWKRYLALAPKDERGWKRLAAAYENQQSWKAAIDAMGSALEMKPSVRGLVERARFRIRLHDWAGAEADVRQANQTDATDVNVQSLLPIFERSYTWLPSVKALDAKIDENPKDYRLRLDRAEWLVGVGFPETAWDDVDAAYKLNPKSLRARIWNGVMAHERNRTENKTIDVGNVMELWLVSVTAEFEAELKAMDAEPDPEKRAQFLVRIRQPLLALQEARSVDGSPAKAVALLDLGRLPEAGKAARLAVEKHPDDALAWLALGRLEVENGNNKDALDALQRSTQLKKMPEAENLRKTALRRLGKK